MKSPARSMLLLAAALSLAAPGDRAHATPRLLNHQGRIAVNNVNHDGPGFFKFALVDPTGTITYWTNDASPAGQPATAITIAVSEGHYATLLGETNPILPSVFTANDDVRLRTWFSTDNVSFILLTPDRRLTPSPYAFSADTAGSLTPAYETGAGDRFALSSTTGNALTFSAAFTAAFPAVPAVTADDNSWTLTNATKTGFSASAAFITRTVGPPGQTGSHASLADINGRPAIAWRDEDGGDLYYIRATDPGGQNWPAPNIVRVDGALDDVGQYASLAQVAGRPAIAYHDLTHGDLRFSRADDPNGSRWPDTPVTIEGAAGNTGRYCSLAIISGVPAIAFQSPNSGEIRYAWAADAAGTVWPASNRVTVAGSLADYCQHTSLKEINGRPAISFYNQTNGDLRYARFTGSTLGNSADWTTTAVETTGDCGINPSLTLIGGSPAIAYESGAAVKYARATNPGGTTWTTPVTIAASAAQPSLTTASGRPAISWYDTAAGQLKLSLAADTAGTAWLPAVTIGPAAAGARTSLAQIAGLPAIAYHDAGTRTVKYAGLPSATWTASKNSFAEPILASGVKAGGITPKMLSPEIGTWQRSGDDLHHPNGKVGVGRLAAANALEVEGSASKTTAGNWLANSDQRIKTNVRPVTAALEKIDRVRLVDFEYTKEYLAAHPDIEDRHYLNVIAQEFAKVFPEHVKSSGEKLPDGSLVLQVDTYPLTIYSAAAVQELHRENETLKAQLAAQEGRLRKLESALNP